MALMKSKTILIGCVAAVLLFAAACFIWLPFPRSASSVSISFLGITNSSLASFSISNQCRSTLTYLVGHPQIRSEDEWPASASPRGASDLFLHAHQVATFTVSVPPKAKIWRVPVFWGYMPTGFARIRGSLRHNVNLNWLRLSHGLRPEIVKGAEFDLYVSYSPEVR